MKWKTVSNIAYITFTFEKNIGIFLKRLWNYTLFCIVVGLSGPKEIEKKKNEKDGDDGTYDKNIFVIQFRCQALLKNHFQ